MCCYQCRRRLSCRCSRPLAWHVYLLKAVSNSLLHSHPFTTPPPPPPTSTIPSGTPPSFPPFPRRRHAVVPGSSSSPSPPFPCRGTLVRAYLGLVPTHRTQTGVKLPSKKTDTSSYHSTRKSCSIRVFLSEVRPVFSIRVLPSEARPFITKPQPTISGSAPRMRKSYQTAFHIRGLLEKGDPWSCIMDRQTIKNMTCDKGGSPWCLHQGFPPNWHGDGEERRG